MKKFSEKITIIGSGAAGYTAAIYCARSNMKPLVLAGLQPGGQLTITTDVENFPGFSDVIQGPWLMDQMQKQAENVGARVLFDLVTEISQVENHFILKCDSGNEIKSESIIIATGAQARWLGLESEKKFNGKGVSACATCDGFFYKQKEVAVVGGGNTAVEEALYLSNICSKVTLIHRRNELRAAKILQDRLFKNPKVTVIWNNRVKEILGDEMGVNSLLLENVLSKETLSVSLNGLFVAIGHDPATSIFKGKIELDEQDYIKVDKGTTRTSVPGIFAAGDCVDKIYRQAVTAAGMGCMAALDAEKWLAAKN